MKTILICLLPVIAAAQARDANACFQARGKTDDATISARAKG